MGGFWGIWGWVERIWVHSIQRASGSGPRFGSRYTGGRVDCFAIAWRLTGRPYEEKATANAKTKAKAAEISNFRFEISD
jgi:hypothetical protein